MTPHVTDELELYALGALTREDAERVAAHLHSCNDCSAEAESLSGVVGALTATLPDREPPARLRERILASARSQTATPVRARAASLFGQRAWRPRWVAVAGLAAAVLLLSGLEMSTFSDLQTTKEQLQTTTASTFKQTVAEMTSDGGRSWYMAGRDAFKGSGAAVVVQRTGRSYVVFHDLKALEGKAHYAIWLVSPDGTQWIRAANFWSHGDQIERVDIPTPTAAVDKCAVTVESTMDGKPTGDVIMQSRVAAPQGP